MKTFTVVFEKPDGYEDVHPELCVEDMNLHNGFPTVAVFDGDPLKVLASAVIQFGCGSVPDSVSKLAKEILEG